MTLEDLANTAQESFIITENILALNGEITPDSVQGIIAYIIEANFPTAEEVPLKSITIIINSPGGCMDSTFALISAMRASAIPVNTVAMGSCASGGLMIAIAGTLRLIDKYCSVMSHTLSTGFPDYAKHSDLERWLDGVKTHTKKIISLYVETTGLREEVIKSKLLPADGDVYLTAAQALEYNLFDSYFESFDQIRDE